MKKLQKLTSILISAAMLCGMAGSVPVQAETAPDAWHDDWLHVENGKVVDVYGNEVWITGLNWFGYNVGSQVFDGVWSANLHDCLKEIADHGFNLLRVPMSVQLLLDWKNNVPDELIKVNTYENPELSLTGVQGGDPMYSLDIWDKVVAWCRENGLKIMIDIHCAETASAGHQVNLWYTDKYSTEDWLEALEWVTDRYKDDDTLIAIDLKNEPHGTADTPDTMAKWDDSTDLNNWRYAAQRGAEAVLNINPNLLIMVEGTEVYPKFEDGADWTYQNLDYSRYPYSYYHHTWWGGNFRGVKELPLEGIGENNSQLVYSPHDYGPLVYEQTWFQGDFDRESLIRDCWGDNWLYLVQDGTAPLLMGEWGGFIDHGYDGEQGKDPDGRNTKWMTLLRDLMIEYHINHTFWGYNENSGDTGGLKYDNFTKWDQDKYELILPALWQTEDGKFISLDHTIPIGVNGITLTEYYNNFGTSETTETSEAIETSEAFETTTQENTTNAGNSPLYGDVDENGNVNIMDVLTLNKNLLGLEVLSDQSRENADVNLDGIADSTDSLNILKYVVKLVSALPVEA